MSFNVRTASPRGFSTTEMDPLPQYGGQVGGTLDQLAALMQREQRTLRAPAGAAPERTGPRYNTGNIQVPQGPSLRSDRPRGSSYDPEQGIREARGRAVPKKYVQVGNGSYLIDDWDAVPLALRPNTQINTAGYEPKALSSAGDDLADSLLRDTEVQERQGQADYNRQRRQQSLNQGYGRF